MTLGAALWRLQLTSPQPGALADFYAATYAMAVRATDGVWLCHAPGREVSVAHGPANQLRYALFGIEAQADWDRLCERSAAWPQVSLRAMPDLPEGARGFHDPDGNLVVFAMRQPSPAGDAAPSESISAELQHFALRTQDVPAMLRFYRDMLGFTLSDEVLDGAGQPRACFLRVNRLHHALALFGAPDRRFDHQSFETADWHQVKRWADRMAQLCTTIVWGVGRHGPGNDVFFMVRDPDGNLAEISSEIEICPDDRPAGQWPHEERTLNLWGQAILRS